MMMSAFLARRHAVQNLPIWCRSCVLSRSSVPQDLSSSHALEMVRLNGEMVGCDGRYHDQSAGTQKDNAHELEPRTRTGLSR